MATTTGKKNVQRRRGKINPAKDTCLSVSRALITTIPKIAADSGNYRRVILADFVGNTDILNLYEHYRITKVQYRYFLVNAPNNNATFPTLIVAPQSFQYTGTPSSLDEVLQYQRFKLFQFGPNNLSYTITVKPKVSYDLGNSVGVGHIGEPGWIGTANNSVQHFTVVDWLRRYNSTSDSTHTIDLEVRIWVDCKNTR